MTDPHATNTPAPISIAQPPLTSRAGLLAVQAMILGVVAMIAVLPLAVLFGG